MIRLALALLICLPPQESTDLLKADEKRAMFEAYWKRMCAPRARPKDLRAQVLRDLGLDPLPERVPLKPHVAGTKEYADYRLERVWFQTYPQVWAAGWLYVPKREGKSPAVLNPIGHWPNGVNEPFEQARCIGLAKKGYVAFAIDPVHETHWPIGLCPAGYMTWNNIRALDYLESRPEVDATRIGCTGASGGGQQTMYLMLVEDRIKVSAPAVMICNWKRLLYADERANCWCNHVPGICRDADMPQIAAAFAPRPAIYFSNKQDWTAQFPEEDFPAIRAVYEKLGAAEKVDSKMYDVPHGYSKEMREQMYAWFNRWLNVKADAVEPEVKTESPQALAWLDSPPPGNKGSAGAVAYMVEKFAAKGVPTREQILDAIGETGVTDPGRKGSSLGKGDWRGYETEKVLYPSEEEFSIPAIVLRPKIASKRATILLAAGGKKELIEKRGDTIEKLLAGGSIVMLPDVRLYGEMRINWHLNAVIWGRPEAGMAAHDVKRAVDWLGVEKARCVGTGDLGGVALLAGVVDPRLAVATEELGASYREGRAQPVIPRLLRVGDLPDIAKLLGARLEKP